VVQRYRRSEWRGVKISRCKDIVIVSIIDSALVPGCLSERDRYV
jgi:hypothetical protein